MADQTIALQARAPQSNFLAPAIRQSTQMINSMTQQAAAQRQTQQAQQAMDIARAVEERVVAAEPERLRGVALENLGKASEIFRNALTGVPFGDEAGTTAARAAAVRMSPGLEDLLPSVEALTTNRSTYDLAYMTAAEIANKRFPNAKADTVIDPKTNKVRALIVGGIPGSSFSQDIPNISGSIPQSPAPQAMGSAPPPVNNMRPPTGFDAAFGGGIPASPEQIEAAARAISGGAPLTDPSLRGLSPGDFTSAQERASRMALTPASMTTGGGGQAAQQDLTAIVQTMMDTGAISQSGVDALRAAAPGKEDQLAQIMRENNIQIMPDEPGAPGMSNAVFRPGEDAVPQRLNVQYAPSQYPSTYGKDPMQAPTPGSATVPIRRKREEAAAERPSATETYDTKRATDQAQADVKFLEQAPAAIQAVDTNLALLDRMVGDAEVDKKTGKVTYPPGGRSVHPGFGQVVGLGFPGLRFLAGSQEADFDAMLEQVKGASFLEAYDTLKGGGPIATIEGEKATKAVSRLGRNISEGEFIAALSELRAQMRQGRDRAQARVARLSGGPPKAPSRGGGIPAAAGRRTSGGFTVMKVED